MTKKVVPIFFEKNYIIRLQNQNSFIDLQTQNGRNTLQSSFIIEYQHCADVAQLARAADL